MSGGKARASLFLLSFGIILVLFTLTNRELNRLLERRRFDTEWRTNVRLGNHLSLLGEKFNRLAWLEEYGRRIHRRLQHRLRVSRCSPSYLLSLATLLEKAFPDADITVFSPEGRALRAPGSSPKRSRELIWQGLLARLDRQAGGDSAAEEAARRFCRGMFGSLAGVVDLAGEGGRPTCFLDRGETRVSWVLTGPALFPGGAAAGEDRSGLWIRLDPDRLSPLRVGQAVLRQDRLLDGCCIVRKTGRGVVVESARGDRFPTSATLARLTGLERRSKDDHGIWGSYYLPGENGRFLVGGFSTRTIKSLEELLLQGLQGGLALIALGVSFFFYQRWWRGVSFRIGIQMQVWTCFFLLSLFPFFSFFLQGVSLAEENLELGIKAETEHLFPRLEESNRAYEAFTSRQHLFFSTLERELGRTLDHPDRIRALLAKHLPASLPYDLLLISHTGSVHRFGQNLNGGNSTQNYRRMLKAVLARVLTQEGRRFPPDLGKGVAIMSEDMKFRTETILIALAGRFTRELGHASELIARIGILPDPTSGQASVGLVNWEFSGHSFVRPFISAFVKAAPSEDLRLGAIAEDGTLFPAGFPFSPDLHRMAKVARNLGTREADFVRDRHGHRYLACVISPKAFGGYGLIGLTAAPEPPSFFARLLSWGTRDPGGRYSAGKIAVHRILLLTFVLSILLSIPGGFLLARLVLRRLLLLKDNVGAIAAGEFSARLPVDAKDELGALAITFNAMAQGLEQREKMRQFVSEQVWDEVRKDDAASLALGGDKRDVAVVFTHLHHFETMTAGMAPDEVVMLLNSYFSRMDGIIKSHQGFIDKLIGDAIMAVFFVLPEADHPAARAFQAAQAMWHAETADNLQRQTQGLPSLRTDIGIHFGPVISGKIGSETGLIDFTVIGDTVNTSARLQSRAARENRRAVVVSAAVRRSLPADTTLVAMPSETLKGKTASLEMFARYD